jgi:WD40 repeat protein
MLILVLACLNSIFLAPTLSQSTLSAQELWTYGRGVIYDFDWSDQNLVFRAGGMIWQVDPTSGQSSTQKPSDFFRWSTSPDGTRFAAQGRGDILIGDTETGTIIIRIPRSYVDRSSIAWQPNINLLTTQGYSEDTPPESRYYVELWNTNNGELTTTVGGYADNIIAFDWHPSGELLAVSLTSDTIIIEDVVRGEQVSELMTGTSSSKALAWSPDGSKLAATTNAESLVNLWRVDTFEPITADNHPSFIVTLAWNADSVRLAGALPGGGVGVWNVETGELISLGVEADDGIDRVVERIAWHGNLLAALDRTRRLRVWNVDNGELVWDSTEHEFQNIVGGIAVSSNGEFVALGYYNSRDIHILDGTTGALIQMLQAPGRLDISDMAWSPSGEQLAVSSRNLLLWSFQPSAPTDPIDVEDVDDLSWSPDGVLAVSSDGQETLRMIDGATGDQIESPEISREGHSLWSPDGRYLASYRYNIIGDDPTVPPYQIDIWQRQRNITVTLYFPRDDGDRPIPSPDFLWLPDSSGMIGYTEEGALWRWPVGAREAEIIVPAPQEDMTHQSFPLSMNACGDLLAVSNRMTDGQIHILDAETGTLLLALDDLVGGRRFFAWGGDDLLFVYDDILHAYRIN